MKYLKFLFALFILLNTQASQAQKTNQEFGFITDNDLYVSFFLDKYYTNGLELFYQFSTPMNYGNFTKKIRTIRVGQKMYNPYSSDVEYIYNQDRPYAGYLYANYTENFINARHILSIGVETGVTGDKSLAREAQNFIHQFYKIDESNGWDTQVKQKYSFGLHASYIKNLWYKSEQKTQISWINKAVFNSIFSTISSGLGIKFNLNKNNAIAPIDNTTFYNTALQNKDENWVRECYFGIKSLIVYQLQDYTVTGELNNNYSQKSFDILPWVWTNDFGIYWNLKQWNLSYHQIFQTSNVKNLKSNWIRYGSIEVSYKF
ncbi:DUF2219 family protein [Wenyingzhuangia sp. 1_MG-2023]|nr:DUF2219 family protein [Wenyingzhuangia sp. 1_MG-2023]